MTEQIDINGFPLPIELIQLNEKGLWKRPTDTTKLKEITGTQGNSEYDFMELKNIQLASIWETLWKNPEYAQIYSLASSVSLGHEISDVKILDVDKALVLANNWDEEPICLDYRLDLQNPRVVTPFWGNANSAWRVIAPDFKTFAQQIGLIDKLRLGVSMSENYDYKNKKILITGATGFIGGAIARRLLGQGNNIRVLARDLAKAGDLPGLGAEVVRGDILDQESLHAGVEGCQIVIHCAGPIDVYASWEHYRALNVEGARNLCEAALASGVERVFFTSSMTVYGLYTGPNRDETSPHQISQERYTDTKIEGERVLRKYIGRGLPVVILQPTQVYGPGDHSWTLKPFKLIKSNLMTMPNGGRGLIQPIFIEDLVDGYVAAFGKGQVGEAYLLAGPEPVELRRYFGHFAKMLGKRWIPSVPRPMAMMGAMMFEGLAKLTGGDPIFTRDNVRVATMTTTYNGNKAASELGFMPKTSLESGMQQVKKWLREEEILK